MIYTRTHSLSLRDAARIEKNPITFNGFIDPWEFAEPIRCFALARNHPRQLGRALWAGLDVKCPGTRPFIMDRFEGKSHPKLRNYQSRRRANTTFIHIGAVSAVPETWQSKGPDESKDGAHATLSTPAR
jgi:hypothetical protein